MKVKKKTIGRINIAFLCAYINNYFQIINKIGHCNLIAFTILIDVLTQWPSVDR